VNSEDIRFGERGGRGETIKQKVGVRVVTVSREPVEWRGDGTSTGGCANEGASNKLGGTVGSIDRGKEMNINEVVDEVRGKIERAAGS
jgi:hypothetical protein